MRKERERQQKQDVMTLGETREQIATLENELAQLKEEKHQLFLQLKKVLNEDDRRRQLIKETRFSIVTAIIILEETVSIDLQFALPLNDFPAFVQKF